jgi:hypothetical protein
MHTVLIVVTALSIAAVIALSVVIARLLREDRQRSDARVAALAMLAADGAPDPTVDPEPVWRTRVETAPAPRRTTIPPIADALPDFELRTADADTAPGLFAERDAESPWGRRFAVIGALAAVLAAVLLAATFGGRHSAVPPAAGSTTAAATANVAPIELLQLEHARESQRLTVSGVVRNPAGGAPLSHLVATAIVFGPDGNFLTSGRAPVDVATLAPGQDSPFAVAIPLNGDVSRYRIGFRSEDGTVIAHVDKRTAETFARKQEQP